MPKPPEACESMADVRAGIDAVDDELMALFRKRMAFIERAAAIKARDGLPAAIPARVEEVVGNVRARAAAAGLDPDLYEAIWRRLIAHAIAVEEAHLATVPGGGPPAT